HAARRVERPGRLARNRGHKHGLWWRPAQGDAAGAAVDVACVVKKRSAELCADDWQLQRKADFLVEYDERLSAHGETGQRIARARLIESKTPDGGAAAGEKTFRQWNYLWQWGYRGRGETEGNCVAKGLQNADAERAGKIPVARQRRVSGILDEVTQEAGAGADGGGCGTDVYGVDGALRGVGGIIAVVAHVGGAKFG